jgi:hypothetical protein
MEVITCMCIGVDAFWGNSGAVNCEVMNYAVAEILSCLLVRPWSALQEMRR